MTEQKNTTDPRTEYIAGLRQLADLLEQHPDLELPFDGRSHPISVYLTTKEDQRTPLAAWTRVLPGRKTKSKGGTHDEYFNVRVRLRGLDFQIVANRAEVCERIVVGTREVVTEVPDPEAVAALPKVEVREVVEDVEWRCGPLLAAS